MIWNVCLSVSQLQCKRDGVHQVMRWQSALFLDEAVWRIANCAALRQQQQSRTSVAAPLFYKVSNKGWRLSQKSSLYSIGDPHQRLERAQNNLEYFLYHHIFPRMTADDKNYEAAAQSCTLNPSILFYLNLPMQPWITHLRTPRDPSETRIYPRYSLHSLVLDGQNHVAVA